MNNILMPVSICTQKEFLIETKLNGFWGVFVVTLGLEIFIWEVSKVNFSENLLDNFFFNCGSSF